MLGKSEESKYNQLHLSSDEVEVKTKPAKPSNSVQQPGSEPTEVRVWRGCVVGMGVWRGCVVRMGCVERVCSEDEGEGVERVCSEDGGVERVCSEDGGVERVCCEDGGVERVCSEDERRVCSEDGRRVCHEGCGDYGVW